MKARDLLGGNLTSPLHKQLKEILANLGFGDGTHGQAAGNHAGVILDYTSNAVANTKDSVKHGLNRIPNHVFPTLPPNNAGASLHFLGADKVNVYLACNVASTTFKLYVE